MPGWIETGRGPRSLVFLHGVSGGAAGARELLAQITPPGWRGLAWNMPGYGAQALPPAGPGFAAYADALIAMLDAAGLARTVLVGHSMGGMIALEAAARYPARVEALVLACCTPAFGAAGPQRDAFLARRLGPLDEGASMYELAVELIPGMVGPGADPEVVAAAVLQMAEIPPDGYRAALNALVGFDRRGALAQLTMPALVLAGRHDRVSTPLLLQRMAGRMPAAIYRELDAGHLAPYEAPEDFAAAVTVFLAGLPAPL